MSGSQWSMVATSLLVATLSSEIAAAAEQPPADMAAAKAFFLVMEEKFNTFANKPLSFNDTRKAKAIIDGVITAANSLADQYAKLWQYKDATWTLASLLRRADLYDAFAQKLIRAADNPPFEIKELGKKACRVDPKLCGAAETQYKDAILPFVTPVQEKARDGWRSTIDRAAVLGITNDYVEAARQNLSRSFAKRERIGVDFP